MDFSPLFYHLFEVRRLFLANNLTFPWLSFLYLSKHKNSALVHFKGKSVL